MSIPPLFPTTPSKWKSERHEASRSELGGSAAAVEDVTAAPAVLPLGISQSGRSEVQARTRQAEEALDAQGAVEGRVFTKPARSIPEQAAALQAAHQATGARRLERSDAEP